MGKLDLTKVKRFPVKGVCSSTGGRFILIFHKKSENEYYLERVLKTNADIDEEKNFSLGYEIRGNLFGEGSIEFKCPYCGTTHKYGVTLVKCNVCGYIGCARSVENDGNALYYTCPVCGESGELGGDIENLGVGD